MTTILCPYCRRPFDTDNDLRQHLAAKARISAEEAEACS